MTLPIPLIDHVVVNVRDQLDAAAALWTRLGFLLTPRGHHTLGSSNNLAILGTDYIELLGVMPGESRSDVLSWPAGLNGLVFKTTDSDATYRELAAAGVPVLPPQAFSRPVDMGDGRTEDAAFRTVRLERDAVPAGRAFFCHHLTPQLVWHDPWRRHPNGATGLAGMLVAAEDPGAYAALFALMFGESALRQTADGIVLAAGLASVEVLYPAAVQARLGPAAPPLDPSDPGPEKRTSVMAALTIRTAALATARTALAAGGFAPPENGPLTIPAAQAGGLAISFVE